MWRELKFKTNPKQKECFRYLLDDVTTEVGYGGGAGGGKSYVGVSWAWMLCNTYSGIRWAFWRRELKRLKQTTLNSYFKFLVDYDIPESQRGVYNAQDGIIKFENGSEILLLDLAYSPSDPEYANLGSLELTFAFVDESAEVDEKAIEILSTRVWRQRNEEYKLTPKLLETFNPDKWHVYRRYFKPMRDWKLPNYRKFITALATDNTFLPKSYIEQLEKASEVTKQRLLYGNFDYDDTPWRLFEYNKLLQLFEETDVNLDDNSYISIDVARSGKDKTVIYVWSNFTVVRVIEEDKSNIQKLGERVKQLAYEYNVPRKNIIADENGVGGGLIDVLGCTGFINNASPIAPKSSKVNLANVRNFEHLKTQCYFALAKVVNEGLLRILYDEVTFKNKLIEELDVIVEIDLDKDWKVKLIKKEEIKNKLWRSPDYADALMMRMFFEVVKRRWNIEEITEEEEEKEVDLEWLEDEETTEEEIVSHPYEI